MKMEIERRFLIEIDHKELSTIAEGNPSLYINQGYFSKDGSTVRIRNQSSANPISKKFSEQSILTIKGKATKKGRAEFEYNIPTEDGEKLFEMAAASIEKVRVLIPHEQHTIELDLFMGKLRRLVIAEVEFDDAKLAKAFKQPSWFGPEITKEKGWSNKSLAFNGLPNGYTISKKGRSK